MIKLLIFGIYFYLQDGFESSTHLSHIYFEIILPASFSYIRIHSWD